MNSSAIAEQIFMAGVASVLPDKLISKHLFIRDSTLFISSFQMPLAEINNIFIVGAGKASAIMAKQIESILGDRISDGQLVIKYGHGCELQYIKVTEAGHPVPDNSGYLATKKILEMVKQASEKDLIICLLSGGGSSLLIDLPEGGNLNDIIIANNLLLKCGADITEMNTVRKHLSKIKGGQLSATAYPATLVSIILSDVIGDSLDTIASGPTTPDATTFEEALCVLEKYELLSLFPGSLLNYLEKGVQGIYPETPKPGNLNFSNSKNIIIGSNKIALEACKKTALELGLNPFIITDEMQGDTTDAAKEIVNTALIYQKDKTIAKPCCLLFGGETTLKVNGAGLGGRNQHLALRAASLLENKKGITVLSAGTDGNDGPTLAAGAVVNIETVERALSLGLGIEKFLEDFDSFHFFEKAGGHIIIGPTMTNVMDLAVIIVE